ncbi:hypothetical protein AK973_2256 [Pseudomonas brassicacearum]|nr:hypothetical protein AK973_2256 [Pseudomonas brassicacearum]
MLCSKPSSRASSLPQGVCGGCGSCARRSSPVGASLLAMRPGQSTVFIPDAPVRG